MLFLVITITLIKGAIFIHSANTTRSMRKKLQRQHYEQSTKKKDAIAPLQTALKYDNAFHSF